MNIQKFSILILIKAIIVLHSAKAMEINNSTLKQEQNINYSNTNLNVLGQNLQLCSSNPLTGYKRDGYCSQINGDYGKHIVCAETTQEFLEYTKQQGNDLSTPNSYFPGLKPGDKWCLCATRVQQAMQAGKSPKVDLQATHQSVKQYIDIQKLKSMALPINDTINNNIDEF